MKKTLFAEIALLCILTGLLFLLIDPLNMMMKLMVSLAVVIALVIVYVIKFIVIWREKPQDERDLHHRYHSSWWSYIIVSMVTFTGVVVESLQGSPDPWLVASLASLFIIKIISLIYLEIYK